MQFKALTENLIRQFGVSRQSYSHLLPELLTGFEPNEKLLKSVKSITINNRKKVIVIFPGSSKNASFRRWELKNYLKIIDSYIDKHTIIIAGGPEEIQIKNDFNSHKSILLFFQ